VAAAWAAIPEERRAIILAGEAAIVDRRKPLDDWVAIGKAFHELQHEAMQQSNSKQPKGRRYSDAYALLQLPRRDRQPAKDRQERSQKDDLVRDDGDRRFAGTAGRPAHLDFAVNAKNFSHFRLELGIAPLQVVTNPRLRGGRLLCGFTSCAARILHTVPWASCARHGWPALGP
jgi:hypothetical protein